MTNKSKTYKIAVVGLFIALSYLGTSLHIAIPIAGGGSTMFHFGNVFCLLASLLLGGVWGGTSGALGMALFDFTSEKFQYCVPETLVLKFIIGIICGFAFKKLKIKNDATRAGISCSLGMCFNIIFSPLTSYLSSKYILGTPDELASILSKWTALTTFTNAIIAVIFAVVLYESLKYALAER